MKSLIREVIIASISSTINHLCKLKCLLVSLKKSENPLPSDFNESDYLTSDRQLGIYLNKSPRTVENYRYKGIIPFSKVNNSVIVKKADVDEAVKIYPFLAGTSEKPVEFKNPLISITVDREQAGHRFVYLHYQSWNCTFFLEKSFFEDVALLTDVLILAIYARHRIRPFKISPFDCKPALNPVYKMLTN